MNAEESPSWGIIGFGEVGSTFSRHLGEIQANRVKVVDPILRDEEVPPYLSRRLKGCRIQIIDDIPTLIADTEIVLSTVTPAAAVEVAQMVGTHSRGCLFVDFNSLSPLQKREVSDRYFPNADYVDGSILGSIAARGVRNPLLVAGPRAKEVAARLSEVGFQVSIAGTEVGAASAVKMCRSIFMKGLECLYVETLLASRKFGVTEEVLDTVGDTFESYAPRDLAKMLVTTHAVHANRRSHEMRSVIDMLEGLHTPSRMSTAVRDLLLASVRAGLAEHFNNTVPEDLGQVIQALEEYINREED